MITPELFEAERVILVRGETERHAALLEILRARDERVLIVGDVPSAARAMRDVLVDHSAAITAPLAYPLVVVHTPPPAKWWTRFARPHPNPGPAQTWRALEPVTVRRTPAPRRRVRRWRCRWISRGGR